MNTWSAYPAIILKALSKIYTVNTRFIHFWSYAKQAMINGNNILEVGVQYSNILQQKGLEWMKLKNNLILSLEIAEVTQH